MRIVFIILSILFIFLYCTSDKPTPSNSPPVITRTYPSGDTTLNAGDSLTLDLEAFDADGDRIEKTAHIGDLFFYLPQVFRHDTVGTFEFIFRASDNQASAELPVSISFVIPDYNHDPSFVLIEPNDTTIQMGDSVYVNAVAEDPDGDSLTYLFIHDNDTLSAPHWYVPDEIENIIEYVVSDGAENVVAYRSVVAENMPPVCNITSPDDGDTLLIGNISITAEASDGDGFIEAVEFYIDNILLFTDTDEPYECTYIELWVKVGDIVVKAVAIDNNGARTDCVISINSLLFLPVNQTPDTIFVPQDFPAIQEAVDHSLPGDIIKIADGTYEERVNISHPLNLFGNGENTFIFIGQIQISSDSVQIKDLAIWGYHSESTVGPPAIKISNSNYILIDGIWAMGGRSYMEFGPFIECWHGGPGIKVSNSHSIIIQNSYVEGGPACDGEDGIADGGPGVKVTDFAQIFIVNSYIHGGCGCGLPGGSGGIGVEAYNQTLIGIRNCDVGGGWGYGDQAYAPDYFNDGTSTIIIFP